MVIYLVQSTSDLVGNAGYCRGLIEAEHDKVLVTFADLTGKQSLFNSPRRLKKEDDDASVPRFG
jgi:hypothetical protein